MKKIILLFWIFVPLIAFSNSNFSFNLNLPCTAKFDCVDTIDSVDISLDTASVDVFPNPADDTLCIKYTLINRSRVSVKIYELSGVLADTLFEGEQAKGEHLIEYRTLPLKNGVYLIEILAGADEKNKKITIQK